jgi:cytochrome P450
MSYPPVCSLRETIAFARDPAAFTAGAGLRLGDLYRVRLPGYRLFVVTDAELVEQVLVRKADHFVKSRAYWGLLRRALGESMGSLDDERWEYLHRIQGPFFTPRAVRGYMPTVGAQTTQYFETLAERLAEVPEVPILEAFGELNTRIELSVLFGRDDDPAHREVAARITDGHEILAWVSKYPWRRIPMLLNGVGGRLRGHLRFFGDYAERLKGSRRASNHEVLLDALVKIPETPGAPRFAPELLRNEVVFHLGAGTETQAATESWALYLLARHPEALQRLRCEIEAVAGRRLVSLEDVDALAYTKQVVQETLRLFPPAFALARDCVRSVDLGPHPARSGDTFLISVYALHRNPRYWEAPEAFRPERFGDGGATSAPRYRYAPFGAGRHVCIGQHLALPAMVLAVAQFAQRFDWAFTDPDIRPIPRPSLKPSRPFKATVTLRA